MLTWQVTEINKLKIQLDKTEIKQKNLNKKKTNKNDKSV